MHKLRDAKTGKMNLGAIEFVGGTSLDTAAGYAKTIGIFLGLMYDSGDESDLDLVPDCIYILIDTVGSSFYFGEDLKALKEEKNYFNLFIMDPI
jgi:hypothetical protein